MNNKKEPENKVQYMPIFMSIGISIGVALGAANNNIPLFMCIGLSIGVGLGALLDARVNEEGKNNNQSEDSKEENEE